MLLGMILPFLDAAVLNNKGLRIHNFQSDPLPIPQIPMPSSQSLSSRKDNRYVTGNSSVSSQMMEMLSNVGEELGAYNCLGVPFPTPQMQEPSSQFSTSRDKDR